jgi:uncharacterized protein
VFHLTHLHLDQIPLVYMEPGEVPGAGAGPRRLVIWQSWFSGRKEDMQPYLADLAARGFVALSYDPWQHGERGSEDADILAARVFGNFRRYMWPIIAHTTEDVLRVIDWAVPALGVQPQVFMGGISMGGDVAVAAAGLEKRITCVAAGNATPDWLRPGMNIPAGEPDAYAWLMYGRLNPLTHLDAYAHCPAITFECGADDDHVPPDGALRFQEALQELYPPSVECLRVNLHAGIRHTFTPAMWDNCLEWFETQR